MYLSLSRIVKNFKCFVIDNFKQMHKTAYAHQKIDWLAKLANDLRLFIKNVQLLIDLNRLKDK